MRYKQSGRNDKYPEFIDTWRYGEKVPDWLSDISKVRLVLGDGSIVLDIREFGEDSFEIIRSDSNNVLISVKSKSNYVCYSKETRQLFSLRPVQLDLLYKKIEIERG